VTCFEYPIDQGAASVGYPPVIRFHFHNLTALPRCAGAAQEDTSTTGVLCRIDELGEIGQATRRSPCPNAPWESHGRMQIQCLAEDDHDRYANLHVFLPAMTTLHFSGTVPSRQMCARTCGPSATTFLDRKEVKEIEPVMSGFYVPSIRHARDCCEYAPPPSRT
jgi:hypothetical protein